MTLLLPLPVHVRLLSGERGPGAFAAAIYLFKPVYFLSTPYSSPLPFAHPSVTFPMQGTPSLPRKERRMGSLPFLGSSAVAIGRASVAIGRASVEDLRSGAVRCAYTGEERARQG